MAEQSKRGSQLENGEHGHNGKKARAQAMPNGVIKREQQEIDEAAEDEEEQEEGEVSQGSSAEAMEEAQINLTFGLTLFHCRSCRLPLKPPTFKCEYGHVICGTCCNSHEQVCRGAAIYSPCVEVDAFVREAKQPCAYEEFGCKSSVVYFEAADHQRACQWAPCSCPDPGCGFFSSPVRLADHFAGAHSWPVTEVSYGKPLRVALPLPQVWHVLVGEEGRRVFLVSACTLGAAAAVSLVCVRANGDGAEGAPQFRCKLWAEAASSKESVAMMMPMVRSCSMSGAGAFSAADQAMFLAMPPEILDDVSGEAPVLMVRIDRAGAAAKSTTAPRSSGSRRLLTCTDG
ncbi:putative E3 ubiquitin-protein ligase SINA-like 6 [Miscanthus floridulus]|uniref:putative E3 ubiquitin-protein ligase SINA-like 6 n=1 Tax=Miscanthus floridulus TaxID=154761 RepID=UPI0034583FBC